MQHYTAMSMEMNTTCLSRQHQRNAGYLCLYIQAVDAVAQMDLTIGRSLMERH